MYAGRPYCSEWMICSREKMRREWFEDGNNISFCCWRYHTLGTRFSLHIPFYNWLISQVSISAHLQHLRNIFSLISSIPRFLPRYHHAHALPIIGLQCTALQVIKFIRSVRIRFVLRFFRLLHTMNLGMLTTSGEVETLLDSNNES